MFLPLYDGAPLRYLRRPIVNYGLILLNVVVFTATIAGLFGDPERVELALGMIPAVLFDHATLAKGLALAPEPATLVTSLFLHANIWHLGGNMLFLWVFGDNVEDALGSARYLVFYLACGIGGALAYALMAPESQSPLIGASGAISGVVIAYLILYPHVRVFGLLLEILPLRVPAIWCLGAWIIFQVSSAFSTQTSNVGYWAHVGGIALGAILTPFMRRAGVPLFSARRA